MIRARHRPIRRSAGLPAGLDRSAGRRDPAHVFYDHACDLLAAAHGLRATAGSDGSTPAIAATLGCMEAALDALAAATVEMGQRAVTELAVAQDVLPEHPTAVTPGQADRHFDDLVRALRAGRAVAGHLRERVGPAVAELTHA